MDQTKRAIHFVSISSSRIIIGWLALSVSRGLSMQLEARAFTFSWKMIMDTWVFHLAVYTEMLTRLHALGFYGSRCESACLHPRCDREVFCRARHSIRCSGSNRASTRWVVGNCHLERWLRWYDQSAQEARFSKDHPMGTVILPGSMRSINRCRLSHVILSRANGLCTVLWSDGMVGTRSIEALRIRTKYHYCHNQKS